MGWSGAATKWMRHERSGGSDSLMHTQVSAPWTSPYPLNVALQKPFDPMSTDVRGVGVSSPWEHSTWSSKRYYPYAPREHRSTSSPTWMQETQDLVSRSTPKATVGESGAWSDSHVTTRKRRKTMEDPLSIKERKAFFIHTPTPALVSVMAKFVDEVHSAFPHFRKELDCWLHPSPPRRSKGCLSRIFCWTDESGKHKLGINFGIIALIVDSFLTEKQKEGWIMHSWHLSHLCGNWACCNWRHFTVEPGKINLSRNACFKHRSGCVHEPKCMKEKKQRLNPIPKVKEPRTDDYQAPPRKGATGRAYQRSTRVGRTAG